jgi:hypothetical protein
LSANPPGTWGSQVLKERAGTFFLSRNFKRIVIGLDNVLRLVRNSSEESLRVLNAQNIFHKEVVRKYFWRSAELGECFQIPD